jgi:hypothetical protein
MQIQFRSSVLSPIIRDRLTNSNKIDRGETIIRVKSKINNIKRANESYEMQQS